MNPLILAIIPRRPWRVGGSVPLSRTWQPPSRLSLWSLSRILALPISMRFSPIRRVLKRSAPWTTIFRLRKLALPVLSTRPKRGKTRMLLFGFEDLPVLPERRITSSRQSRSTGTYPVASILTVERTPFSLDWVHLVGS